jgi:hypothetical protein
MILCKAAVGVNSEYTISEEGIIPGAVLDLMVLHES